ncbi:MAG: tetratricopeptide repeat protein [Mariprofundaceae bacterium]|nr:tetratricopeptide repeat protein [Mariprofundaceae bacterium]
MKYLLTFLSLAVVLSGCATAPTSKHTGAAAVKAAAAPVSLARMDTQFLYLAAQRGLAEGQPALAIRFLQALLKKEPTAMIPRVELVDLLLESKREQQLIFAQKLLEDIPTAVVAAFTAAEKAEIDVLYARTLLMNGEAIQAAAVLKPLLLQDERDMQVRQLLIRMYIQQDDLKQAHKLIQQGLQLKESLSLRRVQVQLYLKQQRFKKADKILLMLQKKYPREESVVLQRSALAEQQKQGKKAERLLQKFIQTYPKIALQSYYSLAGLYVRQDRFEKSIAVYQSLLLQHKGDAQVYVSMGKVHYELNQYPQAAQAFAQAVLMLSPTSDQAVSEVLAEVYFYWAASLEANHQWQQAVPHYRQLQSQHRYYVDAQLRLASIDLTQQQWDAAETRLLQLQTLFAQEIRVAEMLSNVYLMTKDYDQLLKNTEKSLKLEFSALLLFNRSIALDALQRFAEFDAALDRLLQQKPDDSEALNFYAYSLAERGQRLLEAQSMAEKALKLKPQDGYYLDSLAWVYFKQQQYDEAVHTQQQAVALIADDAIMQDHLGDMLWRQGAAERARMAWQKAVDLEHEAAKRIQLKIQHGLL